jgi:hypothetical protein
MEVTHMLSSILTATIAGLSWLGAALVQYGTLGFMICQGYWAGSKLNKWMDFRLACWKAKRENKKLMAEAESEDSDGLNPAVAVAVAT